MTEASLGSARERCGRRLLFSASSRLLHVALVAAVASAGVLVAPGIVAARTVTTPSLDGVLTSGLGDAPYSGELVVMADPLLVMRNGTGFGNNLEVFRSPTPGAEPAHEATIAPPDGVPAYDFGSWLATDGGVIVAGARNADSTETVLYVFEQIDGAWQLTSSLPTGMQYLNNLTVSNGVIETAGPLPNGCCSRVALWQRISDGTWGPAAIDQTIAGAQPDQFFAEGDIAFLGNLALHRVDGSWTARGIGEKAVAFDQSRLLTKTVSGSVRVYDVDASTLALTFVAEGSPPGPTWASVGFAFFGDRVFVGRYDADAAGVEVLDISGQELVSSGVIAPPESGVTEFGAWYNRLALFGDTLVVPGRRGPSVVYGFGATDLASRWGIQDGVTGAYASEGRSIAISGDHLATLSTVVGRNAHPGIDVYERHDGGWGQQQRLDPLDANGNPGQVQSIALEGGRLVAGVIFNTALQLRLVTWYLSPSGTWVQHFVNSAPMTNGQLMAMKGDHLVVYPTSWGDSGHSFVLTGSGWSNEHGIQSSYGGQNNFRALGMSSDAATMAVASTPSYFAGSAVELKKWITAPGTTIQLYSAWSVIQLDPQVYVSGLTWVDDHTLVAAETNRPDGNNGLYFYDVGSDGATTLTATVSATGMAAGFATIASANGIVYASRGYGYSSDPSSYVVDVVENTGSGWAVTSTIQAPDAIGNPVVAGFGAAVAADGYHLAVGAPSSTPGTVVGAGASVVYTVSDETAPTLAQPSSPTNVIATPGTYLPTISWSATASAGSSPVTGYKVVASPGTATCGTTGGTSCEMPGLQQGHSYTFTVTATSTAGMSDPSAPTALYDVPSDTTPPVVTPTYVQGGGPGSWVSGTAWVRWTVDDPTANVPEQMFISTEGANQLVTSEPSCDPAGNCASGQAFVNVDKSPPTVTFTSPADGLVVQQGDALAAGYTCADSLSPISSCTSDLGPDGVTLDTSRLGPHNVLVRATDVAYNQSTTAVTYTVVDANGTYPPVNLGRLAVLENNVSGHGCSQPNIALVITDPAATNATFSFCYSSNYVSASAPTFNPDHSMVAVTFGAANAMNVFDAATGRYMFGHNSCLYPQWSPDGTRMACSASSQPVISLLDGRTGNDLGRVPIPSALASDNSFSIDWLSADTLLISSRRNDPSCMYGSVSVISKLKTDGTDLGTVLTSCEPSSIGGIQVSPDSTQVAFTQGSDIHVLDLTTLADTVVAPESLGDGFDHLYYPVWTWDGAALGVVAFGSNGGGRVEQLDLSTGARTIVYAPAGGVGSVSDFQLVTAPPAPTVITVITGNHSATITWLKPATNGGSAITGYTVTARPGGQTCSTDRADILTCTITGLTNGVNYTFTVTAHNAVGDSPPSQPPGDGPVTPGLPPDPVTVLPPEYPYVPDPGTGLPIPDGTQVTIRWLAAASDPALPVIGYRATASPGGQFCTTDGELFCTITGLTVGVDYSFTVVAINGIGQSPVTPPSPPTGATVAAGDLGEAVISWTPPASNGGSPVTGYTVTASDGGGSCTTTGATTCTIAGLTLGATYTFTVTATNVAGTSDPSALSDPFTVPTDTTAPVVSPVYPAGATGGWYHGPVIVTWTTDDPTATVPAPVTIETDGHDQLVLSEPSCDPAGNCASGSATVSIDRISPTLSGSQSPNANTVGWNNTPVVVSWSCDDALSGIGTCPDATTLGEGAGQQVSATAVDVAGNTGTNTYGPVDVDLTAPMLAGHPTTEANANNWFNGDVIIHWTCADALSGPGACPADSTIGGEGVGLNTATDLSDIADNTTHALSDTVRIDRTAPVTASDVTDSWWSSEVTVHLSPADNLSGVAQTSYILDGGMVRFGTSVAINGDGIHTLRWWSTDKAGNIEAEHSATVRIDGVAPTITHVQAPLANTRGWNKTPVTVTFTCSAGASGVSSCTSPVTLSAEGETQHAAGAAVSSSGLTSTDVALVSIDKTVPAITGVTTTDTNTFGWFNTPVTVRFTCTDALSGVASCAPDQTFTTNGAAQSASGSASDAADNVATATVSGINIDQVPPTIDGTATTSPNAAGWYRTNPIVHFTCADDLSGITSCPSDGTVSGDGFGRTATGTATDRAGNSTPATVSGLNIDTLAPTVTLTYSATASPAVSCVATDAGSGLTVPCQQSAPLHQADGSYRVTGTATDRAGNTGTGTVTYSIVQNACQTISSMIARLSNLPLSGNDAKSRNKAVEDLNESLRSSYWNSACTAPVQPDGKKVFDDLHGAVQELAKISSNATITEDFTTLLTMSRGWASAEVDAAIARNADSNKVTQAQQQLALGDQKRDQNNPGDAVNAYRQAWDKATKA